MFACELKALFPWLIAPAFAAEALIVERMVEPRREAVQ
jgi:hypothetical protein